MAQETVRAAKKSVEEIARAYSSPPWWYDIRGFFILTFAYRGTLPQLLRFFGPNIGPYHLEVAIGSGSLFDLILKWRKWKGLPSSQIEGIDYAESMLAGAMNRFRNNPNIKLHHADVAAMPFSDNAFDSVNVANSIHCFPDVDGGLREIFRVLKPGGRLATNVLLFPRGPRPLRWIATRINSWGIRKGILITPYAQEDIQRRIVAAGFDIQCEEVFGNGYSVLARKPETVK